MMHLVTYTINPKRDITPLIRELQSVGAWCHPMDDAWIIVSNETTPQLYSRIIGKMITTDRLLIVEVLRESVLPHGWLTSEVWQWINYWMQTPGGARSVGAV